MPSKYGFVSEDEEKKEDEGIFKKGIILYQRIDPKVKDILEDLGRALKVEDNVSSKSDCFTTTTFGKEYQCGIWILRGKVGLFVKVYLKLDEHHDSFYLGVLVGGTRDENMTYTLGDVLNKHTELEVEMYIRNPHIKSFS